MRLAPSLSVLLLLPGCGILLGECISGSVSGQVVDDAGAPIDGAEVSQCDWDDCERLQVVTVTDADGRFESEVDSRKKRLGGCEDAWIRVAATGCTPQEMPAADFVAPIVLDCSSR